MLKYIDVRQIGVAEPGRNPLIKKSDFTLEGNAFFADAIQKILFNKIDFRSRIFIQLF